VPTFLIDILKKNPLDFSAVDIDDEDLSTYEPEDPRIVTLLYQTGYLTIKDFVQMGSARMFSLRIPNREIEHSFLKRVVGAYVGQDPSRSSGISFSSEKRTIVEELVEELPS
jgi:hypothetical protein